VVIKNKFNDIDHFARFKNARNLRQKMFLIESVWDRSSEDSKKKKKKKKKKKLLF